MVKFFAWIISIIVAFSILIIAATFYLSPNDIYKCSTPSSSKDTSGKKNENDHCQEADVIVAISGGNTSVRTKHAVDLYKKGWAKKIIFSGAAADKNGPSNASTMKAEAVKLGVSADDIIEEGESNNTNENAQYVSNIIENNHFGKIILTTSAYHQRRAYLEFSRILEKQNTKIINAPAEDPEWTNLWWLTPRGWYLSASELGGIVYFYINLGVNQ